MKIAIMGAGVAGLASLRRSVEEGHECVVFEQSGNVGGIWNYTDDTEMDEFGLPVHSSMYQGLRTNITTELLEFEDYPFEGYKLSYVSQPELLKYINDFAKHFNLLKNIKFFHHVVEVDPLTEGKWSVKVTNLKTKITETGVYDAIFVCVGINSVPKIPQYPGTETFTGEIMHCHSYRKPEPFKNKKVLVVGAGFSGIDISTFLFGVAEKVILVNRRDKRPKKVPEGVINKPEIVKFNATGVTFKDDSEEVIDTVIFCTGYLYSFPFLTPKCKIEVEDKWVKYLYKHLINVEYPTMAIVSIPVVVCVFPVIGVQVRFFLEFLKGKVKVSKQQMMDEINELVSKREELGHPGRYPHRIGLDQGVYLDDLADTAGIKRAPAILQKLYEYQYAKLVA